MYLVFKQILIQYLCLVGLYNRRLKQEFSTTQFLNIYTNKYGTNNTTHCLRNYSSLVLADLKTVLDTQLYCVYP